MFAELNDATVAVSVPAAEDVVLGAPGSAPSVDSPPTSVPRPSGDTPEGVPATESNPAAAEPHPGGDASHGAAPAVVATQNPPATSAPAAAPSPPANLDAGPGANPASPIPSLGPGLALPQVDSKTLAAAAPIAMTGLMLAPILLSALAGGGGSGSATSASPTARDTAAALGGLGDTYGTGVIDRTPATPGSDAAGVEAGNGSAATAGTTAPVAFTTPAGGSATSEAAAKAQLYQRTVAISFHNLDVQLANYMARLAGSHGLDRAKLMRLLHDMDAALARVGTSVYTAAGRQRVHDILTIALQKGQYLVTGTAASAAETAAAINQLTAQYVYNINGRDYTPAQVLPTNSGVAGTAISVALSELGKPYVYGATGPNSFDCSGLTQYAARAAGVQIPRTSQEQYSQLPSVTPANIRPGDLIFPSTAFDSGPLPTHVMMYLGNGKCVEAPHTGANVRICAVPARYSAARWS